MFINHFPRSCVWGFLCCCQAVHLPWGHKSSDIEKEKGRGCWGAIPPQGVGVAVPGEPLEQQLEKQLPPKAGAAASPAQQVAGETPCIFTENQCVKPDCCLDGWLTTYFPPAAQNTTSQGSILQPLITYGQKTRNSQGCHEFFARQEAACKLGLSLQNWGVLDLLLNTGAGRQLRAGKLVYHR